jgi:hypothetical protein
MVNNIFTHGPDSKVFLCSINFLGSLHDGSITANILPYIPNIGNHKICVEQGFPRSGDTALMLAGPISRKQAQALAHNLYLFTSVV